MDYLPASVTNQELPADLPIAPSQRRIYLIDIMSHQMTLACMTLKEKLAATVSMWTFHKLLGLLKHYYSFSLPYASISVLIEGLQVQYLPSVCT